jgi:hypothetical protein
VLSLSRCTLANVPTLYIGLEINIADEFLTDMLTRRNGENSINVLYQEGEQSAAFGKVARLTSGHPLGGLNIGVSRRIL